MTRPSWIWDPNPFNPYGSEVARVISESSGQVVHICRSSAPRRRDGVTQWRLLPPAADGNHGLVHRSRYALSLGIFFLAAAVRRPNLIIPWTNSQFEMAAFILIQRLRIRTFLIVHNPIASRDDAPEGSMLSRLRHGATQLVVHNPALTAGLAEYRSVSVASHPAYFGWARTMQVQNAPAAPPTRNGLRLLFIGSARADKGFNDLPRLSAEAERRGATLSISVGRLTPAQQAVLRQCAGADLLTDGNSYVTDEDLFQHLMAADVLVAPYKDVTVSGTVILALTLGIPVAAFVSPGMQGMVDGSYLVEIDDYSALVDAAFRAAQEPSNDDLAVRIDRQAASDWQSILDRPSAAVPKTKPGTEARQG